MTDPWDDWCETRRRYEERREASRSAEDLIPATAGASGRVIRGGEPDLRRTRKSRRR